jgi:SAM-dependent methyltransferase
VAVSWDYGLLCTEVYDLDKPVGHSFGDVEYYSHQLAGVTGRILEPAAGTGRILIPLLEAGLCVEGIDTSAEMLAACRENCAGRGLDPVLRQADMTSYVEAGAFAAIIIPAGSITLLDGGPATRRALAAFGQSLVPGGRLIVDIPAPQLITGPEPARHWRSGADLHHSDGRLYGCRARRRQRRLDFPRHPRLARVCSYRRPAHPVPADGRQALHLDGRGVRLRRQPLAGTRLRAGTGE